MKIAEMLLREGALLWGTLRVHNKKGHVLEIEGCQEGSNVFKPIATFTSIEGRLAYTVYSKTGTAKQTGEVENASHDPDDLARG